jgi:hypothetical protein
MYSSELLAVSLSAGQQPQSILVALRQPFPLGTTVLLTRFSTGETQFELRFGLTYDRPIPQDEVMDDWNNDSTHAAETSFMKLIKRVGMIPNLL